MGLEISTLREKAEEESMAKAWIADRDLYLDAAKEKVLEAGDPAAAFLLCREGRKVRAELVEQYKLKNKPKRATKAVKGPEEDK